MKKQEFEAVLSQVAKECRTTPEQVRMEMQRAMDAARQNPDPAIQAKWAAIPRKGDEVTLEELMEYVALRVSFFFS